VLQRDSLNSSLEHNKYIRRINNHFVKNCGKVYKGDYDKTEVLTDEYREWRRLYHNTTHPTENKWKMTTLPKKKRTEQVCNIYSTRQRLCP
jgi:hypothetical protein